MLRVPALEAKFPRLTPTNYRAASPIDGRYNCIAYAANDTRRWWWPSDRSLGGHFWPPNAPRERTTDAFRIAFEGLGYSVCADGDCVEGIEKVAIYVDELGKPTHAARQLPSGDWVSKMGEHVDIEHATPEAVGGHEGAGYGVVALYLERPRHRVQQ